MEGLLRPELVCLGLVRKVLLNLLEERSFINQENQESLMTVVTQERKIFRVPGFDYGQWLRNLCKNYGTKKVFSLATCSLTEVVNLQIMPKEHSVVAVQVIWIRSLDWLCGTNLSVS